MSRDRISLVLNSPLAPFQPEGGRVSAVTEFQKLVSYAHA